MARSYSFDVFFEAVQRLRCCAYCGRKSDMSGDLRPRDWRCDGCGAPETRTFDEVARQVERRMGGLLDHRQPLQKIRR